MYKKERREERKKGRRKNDEFPLSNISQSRNRRYSRNLRLLHLPLRRRGRLLCNLAICWPSPAVTLSSRISRDCLANVSWNVSRLGFRRRQFAFVRPSPWKFPFLPSRKFRGKRDKDPWAGDPGRGGRIAATLADTRKRDSPLCSFFNVLWPTRSRSGSTSRKSGNTATREKWSCSRLREQSYWKISTRQSDVELRWLWWKLWLIEEQKFDHCVSYWSD